MMAFIIISMMGVIALGYVLMNRMDAWISDGGFIDMRAPQAVYHFLVYAAPEWKEPITRLLLHTPVTCQFLDEARLPPSIEAQYILALSENDWENLCLCHEARHFSPDVNALALCHQPQYRALFENLAVNYVCAGEEAKEKVLAAIKEWIAESAKPFSVPNKGV
jgi:hypothetical protein